MTMTLKQLYKKLPSEKHCIDLLEELLWDNQPKCPYCNSSNFTTVPNEGRFHCNVCNSSFSVTAKTIFARTRCDLRKWVYSIYLLSLPPYNLTSRELATKINTTKDTAWLMMNKIKKARIETPEMINIIANSIKE